MSHIARTIHAFLEERDLDHETKILVVPLEELEIIGIPEWKPGDEIEITITMKNLSR